MKPLCLSLVLLGCGPTYLDATGLAPPPPESGLVAHWAFDETSGLVAADDSGNRRDGVISGAVLEPDGRFGGALHFAPGDSVTVERFPYATPSWSFSAWLRIGEADAETADFGTIVSTEVMAEGGWQLQTRGRSSGVYWTFAYWVGPSPSDYAHYECECFELGRWSHATVVVDARLRQRSFYVDGKLARASASEDAILPGTSDLFMGKWQGEGRWFAGAIDDVAIYDRALQASEVAELHERPLAPPK